MGSRKSEVGSRKSPVLPATLLPCHPATHLRSRATGLALLLCGALLSGCAAGSPAIVAPAAPDSSVAVAPAAPLAPQVGTSVEPTVAPAAAEQAAIDPPTAAAASDPSVAAPPAVADTVAYAQDV